MKNPFTLSFGLEPEEYIIRREQLDYIVDSFTSENPSNYSYLISAVRGAGKTVMLSTLIDLFEKRKDWIVVSVTPDMDILQSIAAHLYSRRELHNLFVDAKIDLSAFGIGVSLSNSTPVYDISVALQNLFTELKKKGFKVLITIDEIVSNDNIKKFAGIYQILLMKKLPAFLLMTGLYENINNLQNEKTLTFLYRAPKVYLEPLNAFLIAQSYKRVLDIDNTEAKKMSELTRGYAYAYQVLGYIYWNRIIEEKQASELDDILDEYDATLSEYVYEKIWSELPDTEKRIVSLLVKNGEMKNICIRKELSLTDSQMSVYRDRLKRRGIIDTSTFGYLSLILPRFREIASFWVD